MLFVIRQACPERSRRAQGERIKLTPHRSNRLLKIRRMVIELRHYSIKEAWCVKLEFKRIGLKIFSFWGRLHYSISTSLNTVTVTSTEPVIPAGQAPFSCPMSASWHRLHIWGHGCNRTAGIACTSHCYLFRGIRLRYISGSSSISTPLHRPLSPFTQATAPIPHIPHRFMCASLYWSALSVSDFYLINRVKLKKIAEEIIRFFQENVSLCKPVNPSCN